VGVQVFQSSEETPEGLVKVALTAMASATSIYHVKTTSGTDDTSPMFLGDFVYVDGGFRYLDLAVLRALSTAPPARIRLGGNVTKPSLVYRVDPEYPAQAKANGVQGAVKLHAVLAKDGSVRQMDVVSGDPALVQAALDAVKQWRYQPTFLSGQAVEVDTEVGVVFALKN
jgi:TonB family protein